ncbi:MAG TPA: bifunctional sulfate adenylyltransferase/adenylylsulfate kinase [Thermoanaerobaculia bacterium]|nr:bifunctional sulfate adenylyltransferase/adenylylsulfate kinase [Thermoanaerobaculia bacterium]
MTQTSTSLIAPYGGALVDLFAPADARAQLARYAGTLPSIQISERSRCDLELLATGAFSPLDRFMNRADYERVVREMRLEDGTLFPIPIALPIGDDVDVAIGRDVALRGPRNELLAVMSVDDVYEWDRDEAAQNVFGTRDTKHPLVAEMASWGRRNVSGALRVIDVATPRDFLELRRTPAQVRALLATYGHENVVAFQTRNPMHRAHEELTKRAIAAIDGVLLLQPAVGMTRPGDIDHYTRVRTYQALTSHHFERDRVLLSLLPIAMRMAGPREALWHALIRRNYGANHFIVGRDHASPGIDSTGKPFYGPYDAQQLFLKHHDELGMRMVPFHELVYVDELGRYEEASQVPAGMHTRSISGTQLRDEYLGAGKPLPDWFTRPEVAAILAESHPPKLKQGICIWFTGLSGAGKSTTAELLVSRLLERGRTVTLLDGDVVRTHLSKGLGFSKEDRDANILRIGFVAAEIVRHGGAVVCAAVSPYRATRDLVRQRVGHDRFVEVFVDTPVEICEARDTKGMYAAARRGEVANFTGVSDPYEAPLNAELTLDTTTTSVEANADAIVALLSARGFVR